MKFALALSLPIAANAACSWTGPFAGEITQGDGDSDLTDKVSLEEARECCLTRTLPRPTLY
jgi:hypothetical protein